jgi:hypothetical protein
MERHAEAVETAITASPATSTTPTVPIPTISPTIRAPDAPGVYHNSACRCANIAAIDLLIRALGKPARGKQSQAKQQAEHNCNAELTQLDH